MTGNQADGKLETRKGKGPPCSETHYETVALQNDFNWCGHGTLKGQGGKDKRQHTTTQRTWEFILKLIEDL